MNGAIFDVPYEKMFILRSNFILNSLSFFLIYKSPSSQIVVPLKYKTFGQRTTYYSKLSMSFLNKHFLYCWYIVSYSRLPVVYFSDTLYSVSEIKQKVYPIGRSYWYRSCQLLHKIYGYLLLSVSFYSEHTKSQLSLKICSNSIWISRTSLSIYEQCHISILFTIYTIFNLRLPWTAQFIQKNAGKAHAIQK